MSATPVLPPRPEPPVDYDCCGGGCADCELRLYGQRLKEWSALREAHEASATCPRLTLDP